MEQASADRPVVKLAARLLAETVHRHGGLAGNNYGGEAGEGIKLHRLYTQSMLEKYGSRVESEISMKADYHSEDYSLEISGRCDLIIHPADNYHNINNARIGPKQTDRYTGTYITIAEIKSHSLKTNQLPQGGDELHWAQLMIYGWLYCSQFEQNQNYLQLELIYISNEDHSRQYWRRIVSKNELFDFFAASCHKYLETAGNWIKWQELRDESARSVPFPYASIRNGQRELMNETLSAVKQNGILFAQAPTGIGKTMSTVFPSVRALGHHLTDYVFYLTAMTSTRKAAVSALNELREKGLRIRSIELNAKEKICLEPSIFCDTGTCPYAVMYYNNLPEAIASLLTIEEISLDVILAFARKYQVCPFELSLDISLFCDFIICDYNYAFDPRVKLDRFFGLQPRSSFLLVDEAHNLPARSREMYSAVIDEQLFDEVMSRLKLLMPEVELENSHKQVAKTASNSDKLKPYKGDERMLKYLQTSINQIKAWFDLLRPHLLASSPDQGFEVVEKDCRERDSMKSSGFLGMRRQPAAFISMISRCRYFLSNIINDLSDNDHKKTMRELMFSLAFFIRISDLFARGFHVTTAKLSESSDNTIQVQLLCLDASNFITETYYNKRPVVFFSATLTPMSYYTGLLDSKSADDPPEQLDLPSPFPEENMLLLIHSAISLKYKDRDKTMPDLLELVLSVVRQKTGNYLLFVPSYSYLHKFRKLLKAVSPSDIECLLQIPGMDEKLKQRFLARFDQHGSKTLLAVAVMGSFFNEGIDLIGDRLSGVIIAGTGMPMISPEREILRQYYDAGIGSGFAYSYIYPGFNRVQQAAGRVIRSEHDRGFILLVDNRYEKYEYRQLFPGQWHPLDMESTEEICDTLQEFWQEA